MKIMAILLLSMAPMSYASADDTRSEEFRNRGALQDLSTTKYTGRVSVTPCKCVRYDYDDGVAVDRTAGFVLPGLCTMNSHFIACHHNGGKYAGQSEICPAACVTAVKVPEVTLGDEAKGRLRAMIGGKVRYTTLVPAVLLSSLGRHIPDWEPLVIRKLVDDYERQLMFEAPSLIYAQAPMRKSGRAFQGGLIFFSKMTAGKNVPQWAFFDLATAELLFSGPTPFLFDTHGTSIKVSVFGSGSPTEAPRGSFISGVRSSFSESVACCGVYSLDDLSKGPILLSDEDAKKTLAPYSAAKGAVDEVLRLHDLDVFYGVRLVSQKRVSLSVAATLRLLPASQSSVVATLPKDAVVEVQSRGGEGNDWFGIFEGKQKIKGYVLGKELKLK